jgi:hypothetical protein
MLQNFGSTSSYSIRGSPPATSATKVVRVLKSAEVRSKMKCRASSQRRAPNPPPGSVTGEPPDTGTARACPCAFSVMV